MKYFFCAVFAHIYHIIIIYRCSISVPNTVPKAFQINFFRIFLPKCKRIDVKCTQNYTPTKNKKWQKKINPTYCLYAQKALTISWVSGLNQVLAPDLLCDFFDKRKFCPLLFFGELVAYFAGCKAALRTEVEAFERDIFCRLMYARDDL